VDPHKSAYLFEGTIEHDLYEGLVVYAPGGALAGGAAKNWSISDDGTIYTFHLRPGLRWSNGEPLTAEDFVYSFRRLVDPATKSPSATLATPVKNAEEISTGKNAKVEQLGMEGVGSDVVRITLSTPTPYFISALTNSCFAPVNRKAVVQSGGTLGQPQTSITNGAYLLDTWSPGSRLVVKKNPYYWDTAHVQIAEMDYLPMPEASKEFHLYLGGELDITWDVPADQIPKLRASRSDDFKLFPFFGNYYYGFDMKALPFKDNPKLRQALAMAIDREAITSEITGEANYLHIVGFPRVCPATKYKQSSGRAFRKRCRYEQSNCIQKRVMGPTNLSRYRFTWATAKFAERSSLPSLNSGRTCFVSWPASRQRSLSPGPRQIPRSVIWSHLAGTPIMLTRTLS
jgi:oligopeptide transport system substrate-binding protein